MMSSSFTIGIDSKGGFTGVTQGKNTYTIAEWNKRFEPKKEFAGFQGGSFGGGGNKGGY
ncbi:hypothetical protein D3C79_1073370 [compost metagenome]